MAAAFAVATVCAQLSSIASLPADEPKPPPSVEIPLELQPYRVRVEILFGVSAEFSGSFRKAVLQDLSDALDRSASALWQVEVREDQRSRPAGFEPLHRLTATQISAQYAASELDKLFLLSVAPAGGGFRIAGREWDAMTIQLGPIEERA
ncbi:MAG TPA: hypothetical protein VL475_05710, partial [Planctomycetaceae bacterium]|nr:hypothetical protein [Planctomycetaceae bacterium]